MLLASSKWSSQLEMVSEPKEGTTALVDPLTDQSRRRELRGSAYCRWVEQLKKEKNCNCKRFLNNRENAEGISDGLHFLTSPDPSRPSKRGNASKTGLREREKTVAEGHVGR